MPKPVWQDGNQRRFTSFIVSDQRLLAAGHPDNQPEQSFLVSINTTDGKDQWREALPANAVKGGTAMDHRGRIFVSLENGKLLCFQPQP